MALLGHADTSTLRQLSGLERKLDLDSAKGRLWRIVLKKSFFAMIENSQDRWCVSLAAMRGTISNTAKPTADARIDFTDLAAARIAQMHHLRDFRSPAIFEFFNTIGT
jgi:hypothetical protein